MGSSKLFSFFIFSSLLVLFVFSSHYAPTANNLGMEPALPTHPRKVTAKSEKVTLSLYYEALCPFCQKFIVEPLAKAVNSDLITILDLELFPWGNAILQPNNTITCQFRYNLQHGEDECYLNTIHACVLNIWPDAIQHFNLIKCIEEQSSAIDLQSKAESSWKLCAQKLGMPTEPIMKCYNSGLGTKLLLQYGSKTSKLRPPHEYVPWVLVNKKPLFEEYDNFVKFVCKSYEGKPEPKACYSHPTTSSPKAKSACSAGLAMVQQKKVKPPA